jgi:hypothetical protein
MKVPLFEIDGRATAILSIICARFTLILFCVFRDAHTGKSAGSACRSEADWQKLTFWGVRIAIRARRSGCAKMLSQCTPT